MQTGAPVKKNDRKREENLVNYLQNLIKWLQNLVNYLQNLIKWLQNLNKGLQNLIKWLQNLGKCRKMGGNLGK
jgi:predicted PurR-regulated permease PerM